MEAMTRRVIAPLPGRVDDGAMTTVTAPATTRPADTAAVRLRTVLLANAATSLAAGVVGLVATSALVDELGLRSTGWTRLVSAGLVLFAVDVALGARSRHLRATALASSIADLAWVAATIVVLATVDLTGAGRVVAAVVGLAVLDLAAFQLWFRHRLHG